MTINRNQGLVAHVHVRTYIHISFSLNINAISIRTYQQQAYQQQYWLYFSIIH